MRTTKPEFLVVIEKQVTETWCVRAENAWNAVETQRHGRLTQRNLISSHLVTHVKAVDPVQEGD